MLSPAYLQIILFCHYSAEPLPRYCSDAPVVKEAIAYFLNESMIEVDEDHDGDDNYGDVYKTTERGRFFVDMLCATPLPKGIWIDPRERR